MSDPHAAPLDDEPRSPMWLPALGAALFVGVALWWAVTPSAAAPAPEASPGASVAVNPTPPASAPPARPTMPGQPGTQPGTGAPQMRAPAGAAAPAGSPGPAGSMRPVNTLNPTKAAEIQKRLQNVHDTTAPAGGGARR
jgi:hypothetical protein